MFFHVALLQKHLQTWLNLTGQENGFSCFAQLKDVDPFMVSMRQSDLHALSMQMFIHLRFMNTSKPLLTFHVSIYICTSKTFITYSPTCIRLSSDGFLRRHFLNVPIYPSIYLTHLSIHLSTIRSILTPLYLSFYLILLSCLSFLSSLSYVPHLSYLSIYL